MDECAGIVLHNFAHGGDEQLRYLVPRYYDLLVKGASCPAGGSGLDLAALFQAATGGLSITQFLALSFVVYAWYLRYMSASALGERSYGGALQDLAGNAPYETWAHYRALVEMPIADAVEAAGHGPDAPVPFRDFVALHARPLLGISERESVPIWLPWVASKIADDPRWLITSQLRGDSSAIARLDGLLGVLFEAYVFDLLSRCYPSRDETQVLYLPIQYETVQGREESNDATLFIGDAAVFVEVTITSPRFEDLWNGDTHAFRSFVADRLVSGGNRKLWKLSRRIADFRRGTLSIGGVDPRTIRTIHPVVVTLLAWPRHGLVAKALEPVYAALAPFGGPAELPGNVVSPVFVSAEELEMLEEPLKRGWTLPSVLECWRRSPLAESSLKNHLFIDRSFVEVPNEHLHALFVEVMDSLKTEATRLVRFHEPT